jgi:outer membrane immunogenic protein
MRRVICALLGLAFAPSAFAGDFDVLRGMQPVGPGMFYNWAGFYVGGQVGYGNANGDFSNSTSSLIAYPLRDTELEGEFLPSAYPVLASGNDDRMSFGGFLGYNTQWQDLVLGVEANYNQSQYAITVQGSPIARIEPPDGNGNVWTVAFTGTGSVTNLDYGTLRARAGLEFGHFLPYGFAGVALGQANITLSTIGYAEANVPSSGPCSSFSSPPCYFISLDRTNVQTSLLYGLAVGGGMDVALTQNIFMRSEFEYDRFAPVSDIVLSVVSARAGLGLKF